MIKKFKALPALVLALSFAIISCVGFSTNASAQEAISTEKVKLNELFVNISYDKTSYELVRNESPTEVKVSVVDKDTGLATETYGELINPIQKFNTLAASNTYFTTYREVADGFAVNRLYVVINLYADGSFRQINGISDTYWSSVSNGSWTLEDKHQSSMSTTGKFPTTEIAVTGTGVVTSKHTESGGFDLAGLGYSRGNDYYWRKQISCNYTYSVY